MIGGTGEGDENPGDKKMKLRKPPNTPNTPNTAETPNTPSTPNSPNTRNTQILRSPKYKEAQDRETTPKCPNAEKRRNMIWRSDSRAGPSEEGDGTLMKEFGSGAAPGAYDHSRTAIYNAD